MKQTYCYYKPKFVFTILCFFSCWSLLLAQQPMGFRCGQKHLHEERLQSNSDYRKQHDQLAKRIYQQSKTGQFTKSSADFQIPVVVHILHLSEDNIPSFGSSNPTDEQINLAMQHLNDAFANTGDYAGDGHGANDSDNPDAAALKSVNIGISFCLAQRDIFDRPTNGIFRYANDEFADLDSETEDDAMKRWVTEQNNNAFPTYAYANVYLVDQICDSSEEDDGCGIAGYAYLAGAHGLPFDGIVNEAFWFGTSARASTVHIHEFGHYFDLYHTFDGGCTNEDCLGQGDFICDTPPDDSTVPVACGAADNSCNTDTQSGPFTTDQDDLYENYMDYSNSTCNNTFTQGQKDRMRLALTGIRASLLDSRGCIPIADQEVALKAIIAPDISICAPDFSPIISVENLGTNEVTSLLIVSEINGGNVVITNWTGNLASNESIDIPLEVSSVTDFADYEICISIQEVNGAADAFPNNNQACTTFAYGTKIVDLDLCEDFSDLSSSNFRVVQTFGVENIIQPINIFTCAANDRRVLALNSWENNLNQDAFAKVQFPLIDLQGYDEPQLTFDYAYAVTASNTNTILRILASTDCGLRVDTLFNKTYLELATAENADFNTWQPQSCEDWASDTLDLSAYIGSNSLQLSFEMVIAPSESAFSDWGNNLYLDNICVLAEESCATNIVIDEIQKEDISVCGERNGQIAISASGESNLEYSLDGENWQSEAIFTGLAAGNYTPQVRNADFQTCAIPSDEIQIIAPNTPIISAVEATDISDCGKSDGIVRIEASGSTTIEYSLDSMNWQSSNEFVNLAVASYPTYVRNSDVPNCASRGMEAQIKIPITPAITSFQSTNISDCGLTDGTIRILTFDPTIPTEYSLDGTNWQNSNLFTDLAEGAYRLNTRNTNALSCNASLEFIRIAQPITPNITDTDATPLSSCSAADASITITSDFLNTEYSLDGENWQTENVFINLPSGNYSPQIRNANSPACVQLGEAIDIQALEGPSIQDINTTALSACGQNDAALSILTDNADSYEYSIDGGESWRTSNNFLGLAPDTFQVQIRSSANTACVSATQEVIIEALLEADFGVQLTSEQSSFCPGDALSFAAQIAGGTAPYSLLYTDGTTPILLENYESGTAIEISLEAATRYELLAVTDANGCLDTSSTSLNFELAGDICSAAALKGQVRTESGEIFPNLDITISGDLNQTIITDENGNYTLTGLETGKNYQFSIRFGEDNPIAGVSAFDLQVISKHIVNIETLDSPYKLIAADVNDSGTITTMDILAIRRVLLGFEDQFPNNTAWRFVPADVEYQIPNNASFALDNLKAGEQTLDIIAIKIADVNLSWRAD
ncbi:MAG: M43 family zinc metalloprotease [Bacteroidota bacterium]